MQSLPKSANECDDLIQMNAVALIGNSLPNSANECDELYSIVQMNVMSFT
jgi:hypothetical protein